MLEVNESNTAVESTREAIVDSARLLSAMDSRNPIYHPSVAFVKSAVQQLGGYEFVPGAEDWWLWMRLRDAGYRLGNIPEARGALPRGCGRVHEARGSGRLVAGCGDSASTVHRSRYF